MQANFADVVAALQEDGEAVDVGALGTEKVIFAEPGRHRIWAGAKWDEAVLLQVLSLTGRENLGKLVLLVNRAFQVCWSNTLNPPDIHFCRLNKQEDFYSLSTTNSQQKQSQRIIILYFKNIAVGE